MSRDAALLEEMRGIVREAAAPAVPGESVKAAIGRAARRLGLAYSRAFDHWYGRARSVPASEWLLAHEARMRLLAQRRSELQHELAAIERRLGDMDVDHRGARGFRGHEAVCAHG